MDSKGHNAGGTLASSHKMSLYFLKQEKQTTLPEGCPHMWWQWIQQKYWLCSRPHNSMPCLNQTLKRPPLKNIN